LLLNLKENQEKCRSVEFKRMQIIITVTDLRLSRCRQPSAWSWVSMSLVSVFKQVIREAISSLFFAR